MSAVRVGIAQLNALVGDLTGNARLVLEAAQEAYRQGARVLLTPELMLTGYPPEDLLLRPDFVERCEAILRSLCQDLSILRGMHVVVGHVCHSQGGCATRLPSLSTVRCWGLISNKNSPITLFLMKNVILLLAPKLSDLA